MRALVIEGTADEIVDFVRKTGLTVVESALAATEHDDEVDRFIRQRVRGNAEKHRLVTTYLSGVAALGTVRVRPAIKEDGTENTYLKGRLTTLDEDRVGDVLYCPPSSSALHLRLPFEEVQENRFAQYYSPGLLSAELAVVRVPGYWLDGG